MSETRYRPLTCAPPPMPRGRREIDDIRHIVVHRAGWHDRIVTPEELCDELLPWWPGRKLPYHHFIDRLGVVTYGLPLQVVGHHAGGRWSIIGRRANRDGVGVALLGDFRFQRPTPAAEQALVDLCQSLQRTVGHDLSVYGHDELRRRNKGCPGAMADRAVARADAVCSATSVLRG